MITNIANVDFDGYTAIIPSVSVGNVGQLTADLLISSLDTSKVGCIWDEAILPVVGKNPFREQSNSLSISAEVYRSEENKLIVIQLRSPLQQSSRNTFLSSLVDWLELQHVGSVLILTSAFAHERVDSQIRGPTCRYIGCDQTLATHGETFRKLGWETLEEHRLYPVRSADGTKRSLLSLSGGGFAGKLYHLCVGKSIATVILFTYTSEGDNIPDATRLAQYFDEWYDLIPTVNGVKNYSFPPSWKLLFGNSPPSSLY